MEDPYSVYVGGLPYDCDERVLRSHFEEIGDIVSTKVVYDRETNRSRGFGFVTFSNADNATTAIREMDGQTVEGRIIRVNKVKKDNRSAQAPDRTGSFRRQSPPSRHRSPGPSHDRSPRRSPRRSSYSPERFRRRSRSPDSSLSPRGADRSRKDERVRGPPPKRAKAWEEKDTGSRLRMELNDALDKQLDLKKQLAALEETMERKALAEIALQGKVQKLEEQLAATLASCEQKQASLKKLRRAARRVQQAEELLQSSQAELKELCARSSGDIEESARGDDLAANGLESPS